MSNKKRVLVTGGAKGLGRAIVIEFAKHGYDIYFTYNTSVEKASELKKMVASKYGVEVEMFKVDLQVDEDIDELIKHVDYIDCLVNNAAYNDDSPLFDKKRENFSKIYDVNVTGAFLLSKKLFPKLKKRGGNVVNIASSNGIDTMYEESIDYDASKAALLNVTKNMASAFSPHVRVNAVAPGWIDTASVEDMDPRMKTEEERKILLGRFARVEEIAKVVYFIASEDASYVNGSTIRVDGGVKNGL